MTIFRVLIVLEIMTSDIEIKSLPVEDTVWLLDTKVEGSTTLAYQNCPHAVYLNVFCHLLFCKDTVFIY